MSLTYPWFLSGAEWGIFITKLGIGIEAKAAGIGIPALCISKSGTGLVTLIPVPDWFRHRHFCSFGTGLTGFRTARH
jgi:hypothetical protein